MNMTIEHANVLFTKELDRRGNSRFPVQEEVVYKVLSSKSAPLVGRGRTLNIGSGGILFTTESNLTVGRAVEISVNWPARIGGTCPLKLVALGKVIRSEAGKAAVRIEKYQFKTRGMGGLAGIDSRVSPSANHYPDAP